MILEWRNVSVAVPHGTGHKKILSSVCGSAESGRLMALMGPSGCGKTTFLNVLRGYVPYNYKTNGDILLDGRSLRTCEVSTITFLDQDDFYLSYYKVYEFLEFTAVGRNRDLSRAEIKRQIDWLLDRLFLNEKRNMKISKLSGGERKRLMIANGLIGNTEILLLDEPTTGLDSHLALEIVYFLSEMAISKNKLIITTIHQPSARILSVFHDFAFINEGKMIYCGAYDECNEFFARRGFSRRADTNIAEYLFLLGADERTFISDAKHDIPLFKKYLQEIPEAPFLVEKSETSVPHTQGAYSFTLLRTVSLCVSRQFKSCTREGRIAQLISKLVSLISLVISFLFSVSQTANYDHFFEKAPSLWFSFVTSGFMTFLTSSLQELQVNKVEIRRSYFTFFEWLISVFVFQVPFFIISSTAFFVPLLFTDFNYHFPTYLLCTVTLLPFAFVQNLLIVSIVPYEFLSLIIHTLLSFIRFFPRMLLNQFLARTLKYAVFLAQLFPVNFYCNCIEHFYMTDEDCIMAHKMTVEINFGIYALLSSLFCLFLIYAMFRILKRKLSTPMRLKLEKRRPVKKMRKDEKVSLFTIE